MMPHHFGEFKATYIDPDTGEEKLIRCVDTAYVGDDIDPESLCYDRHDLRKESPDGKEETRPARG